MATEQGKGALALYGLPLARAGFEVIWIPRGRKGPSIDKWQQVPTNEKIVERWIADGHGDANVGVRTRHTPAVDIDILDADMAAELQAWCLENIGYAPTRVGREPKVLLVYATDMPFRKRQVSLLPPGADPKTGKQKVEILGDGQQFVAYGIHENTKKPYVWTSKHGLADHEKFDLTEITQEHIDALFDETIRLAKARGWKVLSRTGSTLPVESSLDEDGIASLDDVQLAGTFTVQELSEALSYLDPDAGYDRWLQVGQALHHQFDGGEDGFDLWDKWSERSFEYNPSELRSKWDSFHLERAGKSVTAKSIIHWAKEGRAQVAESEFEAVCAEIEACESVIELTGPLIKKIAKRIDVQTLDTVVDRIKAKGKELGSKLSTATIRKTVKSAMREGKARVLPTWCAHYVYVKQDDRFYHMEKHRSISDRAFNAEHNRRITTNGEEAPNATRFVLDVLEMPVVDAYGYFPGAEPVFERDGLKIVNTYNGTGVPVIPSLPSDEEEQAIERVKTHFKILFPDERERELLISYLAYTVQHLDRRVTWAPLIYGVQGAGKTFFFEMMRVVLGSTNAIPVSARQLQQQFTGWAEGHKIVAFEEIRLKGHSRYDVVESLKPLIANKTVDIRRMHTDTYSIPNVTNYLLFTNHEDAIPIEDADRRYFILYTSLLTKADIEAFNQQNPLYFVRLFSAMENYAGAILGWLMEYPMHPEFKPNGNAPATNSKNLMRESSQDDEFDDLEDLIARKPRWDVSPELLCLKSLIEVVDSRAFSADEDAERPITLPAPNRMKPVLYQLGFSYVGRARPESAGRGGSGSSMQRYWSRNPAAIKREGIQEFVHRVRDEREFSFD